MQVHGSAPANSQRVQGVAIIDTGLARIPEPGMSQKGDSCPPKGCPGMAGIDVLRTQQTASGRCSWGKRRTFAPDFCTT